MNKSVLKLFVAALALLPVAAFADPSGFIQQLPANTPQPYRTPGQHSNMAVDAYGNGQVNVNTAYQTPVPVSGTVIIAPTPIQVWDGTNKQSFQALSKTANIIGPVVGNIGWTRISTKTIVTGSTTTAIVATAHGVTVGDAVYIYSSSGASLRAYSFVTSVTDANNFVVSPALPAAPANGDLLVDLRPLPLGATDPVNTLNRQGAARVTLDSGDQDTNQTATNLLKLGAVAWGSGHSGVPPLFYRELALSNTGVSGTDGQYTNGKTDALGAIWERAANNQDTGALITAAGATSTQTGADQTNYSGRGAICVLDMTVIGTGSVTLEIDGKDTASGKYFALLTGAAVVSNVTNVYTVYPGNAVSANVSASTALPKTWRVKTTANNANATTYTVGCSVIQ